MEIHKDKKMRSANTEFWVRESTTCRGGVSTLQRPLEGDIFN